MKIQINNEQNEVLEGISLHEIVVTLLQLDPAGKAIAINDTIIPKLKWSSTYLKENDNILVIKACSGG